MSAEQKAEQFTGDLLGYELTRGELRSTRVTLTQYQDYADEHHKGSIFVFFRSVWTELASERSHKQRYKRTLGRMFMSVSDWLLASGVLPER